MVVNYKSCLAINIVIYSSVHGVDYIHSLAASS